VRREREPISEGMVPEIRLFSIPLMMRASERTNEWHERIESEEGARAREEGGGYKHACADADASDSGSSSTSGGGGGGGGGDGITPAAAAARRSISRSIDSQVGEEGEGADLRRNGAREAAIGVDTTGDAGKGRNERTKRIASANRNSEAGSEGRERDTNTHAPMPVPVTVAAAVAAAAGAGAAVGTHSLVSLAREPISEGMVPVMPTAGGYLQQ
jgi:hypothetical protein